MAVLAATTIWEVQTGGDDTNFSGAFDPGQTAGMFTDGAATSATGTAPVFTSASYNFVAGDAGAWLYIASGTNWIAGWYNITSVGSNAATLNATIGQAVTKNPFQPSTVAGCATVASPTGATWTIDYSQQAASRFTYTDLSSTGIGLTASSAAFPFGKQYVGNSIVVTGGTNFTTGRYVLASVAAGVGTFLGAANLHTGAGTDADGAGRMGGCLASLGQSGVAAVAGNFYFIKAGSYSITSASTNISGGCLSTNGGGAAYVTGYNAVRYDMGTQPTLTASGISTAILITVGGNDSFVYNLTLDGAALTSIRGISSTAQRLIVYKVKTQNFTNAGLVSGSGSIGIFCSATGCSTVAALQLQTMFYCEAYSNTFTGFAANSQNTSFYSCLAYGNSGATSDGFLISGSINGQCTNCTAYGNGRDGFHTASLSYVFINCISEANTGKGFNSTTSGSFRDVVYQCATFNNTGGSSGTAATYGNQFVTPIILGSASFFVNAAGGDFSLNTTAGAGAAVRGVGVPGVFPAGTSTGYLDIGAVQHADPAAAGGGAVFIFGG